MASISSRRYSRTSVATWSLRERPVCSFLPAIADARGEARLDVHVHVLERDAPGEVACLDLAADLAEAGDDRGVLSTSLSSPARGEHRGVGDGAADVVR